MSNINESQAQAQNEQYEVMTFQFSESKTAIRNILENEKPLFVGADIAKAVGYKEPHKAVQRFCRYGMKRPIPHPQSPSKTLEMLVIPESDVYRLIINSKLPSAQEFERWVMEEVLPAIRKKGYYGVKPEQKADFIDARDVPYSSKEFNGIAVRHIEIDGVIWFSLNDVHRAIGSRTESTQAARKLNKKQTLARKIWLFGNTHPAWFVNELGVQLLSSGSRILKASQLQLNMGGLS